MSFTSSVGGDAADSHPSIRGEDRNHERRRIPRPRERGRRHFISQVDNALNVFITNCARARFFLSG